MKNQPNKATVKDGLTTAEEVLKAKVPSALYNSGNCYVGHALDAMQSYSDQQNAELREQLKETENSLDGTTYNLKRVVKKCNGLTERVKELETQNKRLKIAHYTIVRAYEEYGPLASVSTKQVSENVLKEIGFDPSKETL